MLGSQGCFATASASALSFRPWIFCQPLLELNEFERIRGGREGLGQQRIWIEGDGCHERVELVRRYFRSFLLSCRICLWLRLSPKSPIYWYDDCGA